MLETLATQRIMAITEEILNEPDADPEMRLFDSMIPAQEAEDGEVMARFKTGYARAADIIQVDQAATVHMPEPVRLTQSTIPKLKHGFALTESMLIMMRRIMANLGTTRNRNVFDDYIVRETRDLIQGIKDRRELLFVAMMIDDLDYNRYGIKITDLSWGTPAGYKVTPAVTWDNPSTATPIADIQTAQRYASDTNSETRDLIIMSRQAEQYIYATAEFRALRPGYLTQFINAGNLPNQDTAFNRAILARMLGDAVLEIYDKRTRIVNEDGSVTTQRFLPANKVILTAQAYANNPNVWDFANATVIETLPGMVPSIMDPFPAEQSGPVSFATASNPQGNPPGEVVWAVQRGFPRKHRETANTVITAF